MLIESFLPKSTCQTENFQLAFQNIAEYTVYYAVNFSRVQYGTTIWDLNIFKSLLSLNDGIQFIALEYTPAWGYLESHVTELSVVVVLDCSDIACHAGNTDYRIWKCVHIAIFII